MKGPLYFLSVTLRRFTPHLMSVFYDIQQRSLAGPGPGDDVVHQDPETTIPCFIFDSVETEWKVSIKLSDSPVCDFDGVGRGHDTGSTSHPAELVLRVVRAACQAVVTGVTVHQGCHGHRAGETVSGVTLQGFEFWDTNKHKSCYKRIFYHNWTDFSSAATHCHHWSTQWTLVRLVSAAVSLSLGVRKVSSLRQSLRFLHISISAEVM